MSLGYQRIGLVFIVLFVASLSVGSLEYWYDGSEVPLATPSSEYETLVEFYGDGDPYYLTSSDGVDYVSLDGEIPYRIVEILDDDSHLNARQDQEYSLDNGIAYEVNFDNYEVNVVVNGPYGEETFEDLDEDDFINYPSDSDRPVFMMKYIDMDTGFSPYRFVFEDMVLMDTIVIEPRALCHFDGVYTPTSVPFEFSGFGNYVGFNETHEINGTEHSFSKLVGFQENQPVGVHSSDSLPLNGWATHLTLDEDEIFQLIEGSNCIILDEGYVVRNAAVYSTESGYKCQMVLEKDGVTVDEALLSADDTYVYRSDIYYGDDTISNFPLIFYHICGIFCNEEINFCLVDGLVQLSSTAYLFNFSSSNVSDSWTLDITAPNSIQDLTIGIDPSATDDLDPVDAWSLPPYPIDKVFLLLDKCYSTSIKSGENCASWEMLVIVPEGQTTALDWNPDAVEGVTITVMNGTSELNPGDSIGEGSHKFTVYANYGAFFDPKPSIYINPPSRQYLRDFTLAGTIADNNLESATYRVNGQEYTLSYVEDNNVASFEEALTLNDGDYSIEVEATDSESVTKSVSFRIDDTNPDVTGDIDVRGNDVLISVSAADTNPILTVECKVQNAGYMDVDRLYGDSSSFEKTFKYYNLDTGEYDVSIFVEDTAGNIAYLSPTFEILDTTPPEITITSPENGTTYQSFPEINVTTNDENATLVYSLNSHNETSVMQLEQYLVEGENSLVVYATDTNGNTASKEVIFIYAPETGNLVNGDFETGDFYGWTIETSNISGFHQSYCEYEVAAEHNYSGTYGCELNVSRGYYGYSLVSLTQAVNLTNVTEVAFNHQQTYEQNVGPGFVRLEFYIDNDMTEIPFSNNTWKQDSINVSEYSEEHNITIQLLALCPVQYAIQRATVEIDDIILNPTIQEPIIVFNSPENGTTYQSFPEINVTTNDENATLIYSLNSHNETSVTQLEQYLVEGENSLVVYATDTNGNTASKEVIFIYAPETGNDLVNGGFETGDFYGWTVETGNNSPQYYHEYEVAVEHNCSGSYGCELNVSCIFYGYSFVSLIQDVNLTDISAVAFKHRQTYANDLMAGYIQLEFYVDDNMTVIPFSNNTWKQEAIDVSGYSGNHNITLRLYSLCPVQMTCHQAKVEIDDITLLSIMPDWNPWNDIDSGDGRRITTAEIQEAVHYWAHNVSAPYTEAEINTSRMNALRYYCINGLEMPEGTENAPLITAERSISGYNVTPNGTFTIGVDMSVEMQSDQYLNSLTLDEDFPTGWNVTPVDNDDWIFHSSTVQWSHNSTLFTGGDFTFTYNVTVPANLTGGIYNFSGSVSATELDDVEVGGDSEVYVMDDWNPWNDWDSANGRYITPEEWEAAQEYWWSFPAPRTGAEISAVKLIAIYNAYINGEPM